MPKLFPIENKGDFSSWFARVDWKQASIRYATSINQSEEEKKSKDLVDMLHNLLRPFLLRRLKDDVDLKIPEKREVILYVGLSPMQRKFYKLILTKNADVFNANALNLSNSNNSASGTKTSLMNILMHLRKCCNHPYLFDGAEPMFNGEYVLGKHIVDNRLLFSPFF